MGFFSWLPGGGGDSPQDKKANPYPAGSPEWVEEAKRRQAAPAPQKANPYAPGSPAWTAEAKRRMGVDGQTAMPAPAGAPTGTPQKPLEQAIQEYQAANPYSPASYEGLFTHLQQQGYKVERPTRAGGSKLSDDKIVGPDGKMYDLITGVDGGNPQWAGASHIPGEYWFNGQRVQRTEELGPGGGWSLNGENGQSFGAPGLAAPFTRQFQAPTGTDDPGFQFAMQQGLNGIQNSAAAKGTLLTGGLLKDLANYTTGAALQGYGQAWNRAKNVYDTDRGTFWGNQDNAYNKLAGMANTGADAASSYAANVGNLYGAGANANANATQANNANWQNTFGNLADIGTAYFRNRANKAKQLPGATPPYSPIENPGFD